MEYRLHFLITSVSRWSLLDIRCFLYNCTFTKRIEHVVKWIICKISFTDHDNKCNRWHTHCIKIMKETKRIQISLTKQICIIEVCTLLSCYFSENVMMKLYVMNFFKKWNVFIKLDISIIFVKVTVPFVFGKYRPNIQYCNFYTRELTSPCTFS